MSPDGSIGAIHPDTHPWPPLIVAEKTPGWVRVRDFLLTLFMWMLFALMLETEFELFFGHFLQRLGWGEFDTDAHWELFFERLMPYLRIIAILGASLVVTSMLTLLRRRRTLHVPPPPALTAAEQASDNGMAEADLEAARQRRIAVVHIDPDGRHRVEGPQPRAPHAATPASSRPSTVRVRDRVFLAATLVLLVGVMGLVAHRYYRAALLDHEHDLALERAATACLSSQVELTDADARTRVAACSHALTSDALTPARKAHLRAERALARLAMGDKEGAEPDARLALAYYDRASLRRPDDVEIYRHRAPLLQATGDAAGAARAYDTALWLAPGDATLHYGRGTLRATALGDEAGAIADYDAALAQKPDNPGILIRRGDAQVRLRRFDDALQSYARAIALDPALAPAYEKRCLVETILARDLAAARADCDKALELTPRLSAGMARLNLTRGLLFLKLAEPGPAAAAYDDVLAEDPNNAAALYGRGVARLRLGEAGGAGDKQAAAAIDPEVAAQFAGYGID